MHSAASSPEVAGVADIGLTPKDGPPELRPSLLQSDLPRTRGGVLRFGLDHRSVARWPIMDALAANARLVARTRDHAGSCRS